MSTKPDKDQKTEAPTAKRKRDARRDGQVAKSKTLVGWVSLLVAVSVIPGLFSLVGGRMQQAMLGIREIAADPSPERMLELSGTILTGGVVAMVPFLIGAAMITVVGTMAQQGFLLTAKPLKPKPERLNPFKGLKNLLSTKSLWETGKQLVTVCLIAAVAVPGVRSIASMLLGSAWRLDAALPNLAAQMLSLVRIVAFMGTCIGVADYAWQRRVNNRELRMTKDEVKREMKDSEGDPHVKAKRRSMQAAMSRNRMLASVADADVVLLNPTHVAVALEYRPDRGAPKVIARGADALAAKIRERAAEAGVPMVEAPPLARALYRSCRVDDEIPRELFQAVATVLAFVQRMSQRTIPVSGPAPLEVDDTWTPAGEDPERSLHRSRLQRDRRRMRRKLMAGSPGPNT